MYGRLRPLLVLLTLALFATGLVACGGGEDEDVDTILRETFSGDKNIESGNLNLALNVDAQGGQAQGPVELRVTGPFQSQGERQIPRFDFALSAKAQGQTFTAGAVSTGDKGFVKFQDQNYEVPEDVFRSFRQGFERAQREGENGEDRSLSSFGVDPRRWLRDPEKEGEESVQGTDTHHITADIDIPRMLQDVDRLLKRAGELGIDNAENLPQGLSEQQRRQIQEAVKDASFDLYTGKDDKILRKLDVRLNIEVPENERRNAGGLETANLGFSVELGQINDDQEIAAPENARPLSELIGSLGGLGGLGGGGNQGGGGGQGGGDQGGGGSAEQSEQLQRYSECLQQAGGDVAKAQECARLLD